MDKNSLDMIEFPRIREILAAQTSFAVSKELAESLLPSSDPAVVTLLLKQSREARHLLSIRPNFSIGGVTDIREPVTLAAKGKVLETGPMQDIGETLSAIRVVHSNLSKVSAEIPALWDIAGKIMSMPDIEENIRRCILATGEIADSASPELEMIRRQLKEKRRRILERLETMMKAQNKQKYIQEQLVTEREGRFVVPIKSEFKKDVRGIVHDVSNTGATLFIEPWETVDMGNDLRQLVIEERLEMERILADLSSQIGSQAGMISRDINLIAELDLALAKARYAYNADAVEPLINGYGSDDENIEADGQIIRLVKARHPLLKKNAVPLTVEMGRDYSILVITGPNAGGKTVALKTIGLMIAMAQAGMPIPASDESCISLFDGVFADIGDQQSIEQTLSTFSWHIKNIINIIETSTSKSLILLDELGISTDPEEGSALARAIMLFLLARRTLAVVTTHYNELKAFAHNTKGIQNASMDFNADTFMPSYHLTIGIPGRSNALSIASRLGLAKEIIDIANETLPKGSREMESLLTDLMTEKQKYESLRDGLAAEKRRIETIGKELEKEGKRLKEQERLLIKEAGDKLLNEAAGLHRLIHEVETELRKSKKREHAEQAKTVLAKVQKSMESPEWQAKITESENAIKPVDIMDINPGDTVKLLDRNIEGLVIRRDKKSNQVELQVGNTKLLVGIEAVERVDTSEKSAASGRYLVKKRQEKPVSLLELDLRGKRADQVEGPLDRYINDAFLAGMDQVRIIHGYATGTVKQIVRNYLASHALVKSFHPGGKEEGGDGVTIANL
jgi:DNA mismatch repair protein MutS2